jgi:hypothetical protein
MQKSPTIATGAQKIRLDENGDLMVFVHLANMRRIEENFQNSDGRLFSKWPTPVQGEIGQGRIVG